MTQIILAIAAILGGTSVAAGAFGSHALKDRLTERALDVFETATRYQMYHALVMLLVAVLISRAELPSPWLAASAWAFLAGIVFFSGSLYALSLSGIKWMGAIAPIGGFAFMVGWGCLAIAAFNYK